MRRTMELIAAERALERLAGQSAIEIENDAALEELALDGVDRIDLKFPKFTDGRAFSQAWLLRRRLGFQGEIRATGEVLVDQLVQMQRSGFTSAVLREGQDLADAQRQFDRYEAYYQGDADASEPLFARMTP